MKRIIVSGVVAALIAGIAGCSPSSIEVDTSPDSVLQFFPDDTYGMLFIDMAGLRGNPLLEELIREQSGARIPESIDEFSDWTGMDLRRDVDEIAVGMFGADEMLTVVSADYDPARVASYFSDNDFLADSYRDRLIYQPDPTEEWTLSFVEGYVLLGTDVSVRGALDRIENPNATALDNRALVDELRDLSQGYHLWAVGTPNSDLVPNGLEAPQMARDLLGSLERGTYQMRLDETVTGRAVGEFATPELARRTSSLFQGLVTLGRIQAAQFPGLGEFLNGLEIQAVESAVHLNFAIEADALRRLSRSRLDTAE